MCAGRARRSGIVVGCGGPVLKQQRIDSARPIILLDLNETLVANSPAHGTAPKRMEKRLADEQYREWLVDLVRPRAVILMTARPETWIIKPLDRPEEQAGWRQQDAFFSPTGWWNPPAIKQQMVAMVPCRGCFAARQTHRGIPEPGAATCAAEPSGTKIIQGDPVGNQSSKNHLDLSGGVVGPRSVACHA